MKAEGSGEAAKRGALRGWGGGLLLHTHAPGIWCTVWRPDPSPWHTELDGLRASCSGSHSCGVGKEQTWGQVQSCGPQHPAVSVVLGPGPQPEWVQHGRALSLSPFLSSRGSLPCQPSCSLHGECWSKGLRARHLLCKPALTLPAPDQVGAAQVRLGQCISTQPSCGVEGKSLHCPDWGGPRSGILPRMQGERGGAGPGA